MGPARLTYFMPFGDRPPGIGMSIRRLKARGIGRLELLAWLNELLETDYTKIEHLADGIAYCQVMDALHPGKVNLLHIQFHARSHSEYESNFRVLQRAFHSCGIQKEIPVRKLVDGVFQEHFELLHWIHDYAHKTYPDAVRKYQGYTRRQQVLGFRDHANMNLVPSYSATSSKIMADGSISRGKLCLDLDLIDLEELPTDLTLDDLVGLATPVGIHDGNETRIEDHPVHDAPPEKNPEDPLLQFVGNSYACTQRADQVLGQLEKTIAIVFAEAAASKGNKQKVADKRESRTTEAGKGKRPTAKPSAKTNGSLTSLQDPPFLQPQLEQLITALAQELGGRAKDLGSLDEGVECLKQALAEAE